MAIRGERTRMHCANDFGARMQCARRERVDDSSIYRAPLRPIERAEAMTQGG
jgi:hypothetical protein